MSRPATTTRRRRADRHVVPPGWRANPSAWPQRLPIIGLALAGFAVAGYLTLFQVG
jgi:hypothetical protein